MFIQQAKSVTPTLSTVAITIGMVQAGQMPVQSKEKKETLVIKVLKEILVRKAVKETKARLDQLDRKENLDLREILETQDLLDLLDRPAKRGTLELLVLLLLLKVRIILTRN